MRVRKLDPDGDYSFGRGRLDFHIDNPDGVAQSVKTRLELFTGEWFLDLQEGTPWYSDVLGNRNELSYGPVLRARILGTPGAKEIVQFADAFDREARVITVTATLDTIYGQVSLSERVTAEVER